MCVGDSTELSQPQNEAGEADGLQRGIAGVNQEGGVISEGHREQG